MLLQRAIIFRAKRLSDHHVFKCEHPLTELFFDFNIKDEKFLINAVHLKAPSSKGLVFFLHGTLNHIQYHLPKADIFLQHNLDVVIMDYPTYGKSKGKLTEALLYEVVELTFKKVIEHLKHTGDVYLVGRSLGTALASNLATKINAKKLMLISPYYSMPDLFNHKVKLFPFKKLKFKFENHSYLPHVKCDTYILHGDKDKLIPLKLAQKLIPHLKSEQHFIVIPGADHFNVHKTAQFREAVHQLMI